MRREEEPKSVCIEIGIVFWRLLRKMLIDALPEDVLRYILSLVDFSGWVSALRTSTVFRRIAQTLPPPVPEDIHERARQIVHFLTRYVQGNFVQRSLQEALLLTPEQVQSVPFLRRRRVRAPGYVHLFDRDSVETLIELHGGVRGLAIRIATLEMKQEQRRIQSERAAARRQAMEERAQERVKRRQEALDERVEQVRTHTSPEQLLMNAWTFF